MSPAILNDLWLQFGLAGWKPAAAALLLPPVPLVGLMCCGALLVRRRPIWGWLLLMAGAVGIWLSCTVALGDWLERQLLYPSRPLAVADLQRLQAASRGAPTTAIVILGSGRESHAPEYGAPNLPPLAMERLRYGVWLSRQTGVPLAFSGGTGHALVEGPSEAEVAAQIAQRDFGRTLKWTESSSRDTRDNARRTLALLRPAGIQRIVLVTDGWQMRRSLRAFEQAAAQGEGVELVAAPMGLAGNDVRPLLRWLPGLAGFTATYHALREYLGIWVGA